MSIGKFICLILASILLCACGVTSKEFEAAEELCKSNGGVSFVWASTTDVYCNNGAEFTGDSVRAKIKELRGGQK